MGAYQAVIALGTHWMAGQESKCCCSCRSHMASPCISEASRLTSNPELDVLLIPFLNLSKRRTRMKRENCGKEEGAGGRMQRGWVTVMPGKHKLQLVKAGQVSRPTGALFHCLAAGTAQAIERWWYKAADTSSMHSFHSTCRNVRLI